MREVPASKNTMKHILQKTLAVVTAALMGAACFSPAVFADISAGSAVVIKGEKTDGSIEVSDEDEFVEPTQVDVGSFENIYTAEDASVELTFQKVFVNATDDTADARKLKEGEFTFQLNETDAEGKTKTDGTKMEAKNKADGSIRFVLSYKDPGKGIDQQTHYYTVSEVRGLDTHIKYDTTEIRMKVDVTRDAASGTLSAKATNLTKDKAGKAVTTFTNTYKASACPVRLTAKKTYIGKKLTGNDFSFVLSGEGITQTKKNDKDGNITFDDISIRKAGTYTFTIKEEKPADADSHIKYDTSTKTVKIKVVDKNGILTPTKIQ